MQVQSLSDSHATQSRRAPRFARPPGNESFTPPQISPRPRFHPLPGFTLSQILPRSRFHTAPDSPPCQIVFHTRLVLLSDFHGGQEFSAQTRPLLRKLGKRTKLPSYERNTSFLGSSYFLGSGESGMNLGGALDFKLHQFPRGISAGPALKYFCMIHSGGRICTKYFDDLKLL